MQPRKDDIDQGKIFQNTNRGLMVTNRQPGGKHGVGHKRREKHIAGDIRSLLFCVGEDIVAMITVSVPGSTVISEQGSLASGKKADSWPNLHVASVSGMIAMARCDWTPPWSENHSRSYGLSEGQVQACLDERGPG